MLIPIVLARATRFITTDDPVMMMMANGELFGFQTNQLVFVSMPLASVLVWLYSMAPSIAWWPILELATLALALITLGFVLMTRHPSVRIVTAYALVCISALPLLIELNFTQPAILAGGVGAAALLFGNSVPLRIAGAGLVLLGVAWRPEAGTLGVVLGTLVAVPFGVHWAARTSLKLRRVGSVGLVLGIGALLLSSYGTALLFGSSAAELEYQAFNNARGRFDGMGDFLYSAEARQAALNAGLSENDWDLYRAWFFQDASVYSTERLDAIAAARPSLPPANSLLRLSIQFVETGLAPHFVMLVTLGLSTLILVWNRRRNDLLFGLGGWIVGLSVLYAVFLYGRLPERVAQPGFVVIGSVILVGLSVRWADARHSSSSDGLGSETSRGAAWWITLLVAFGLPIASFVPRIVELADATPPDQSLLPQVAQCADRTREPLLMFTTYFAPELIQMDPFETASATYPIHEPNIFLDWAQRSPGFEQHLNDLEVPLDVMSGVAAGEVLVVTRDEAIPQLVATYIAEHHGIDVTWKQVATCDALTEHPALVLRAVQAGPSKP